MSTNHDTEDATEQLPADVAGKSAEQLEGIVAMIDSGELDATPSQRAYLAGAVHALRLTNRDEAPTLGQVVG